MTAPALPALKSCTPSLRAARFDDYDGIAAVQKANGLEPKPRAEWEQLWLGNPAFKSLPGWPIGWVLEAPGAGIVGSIGNLPSVCHLEGKSYVCASGHGWSVDIRYRAHSLSLLFKQMRQPGVDLLVTTTPSVTTSSLFERLGWSRVPAGRWDHAGVWITGYRALARRLGIAVSRTLIQSTVTEPQFAAGLPERASAVPGERWQLHWRNDFDTSFEGFFSELYARRPGVLWFDRSRDTLRWHFRFGLLRRRIRILTASEGNNLIGYAVVRVRASHYAGLPVADIPDLQLLEPDPRLCRAMLACTMHFCRAHGIALLDNAGCWLEGANYLNRTAPHHRRIASWVYLYKAVDSRLASALSNPHRWLPTRFEGDASL